MAASRFEALGRSPAPVACGPAKSQRHRHLFMNGVAHRGHPQQPLLADDLGRSVPFDMRDNGEIEIV